MPNPDRKLYVHENFLNCLNMNLHEKKSGFLNKALRPRSLRSLALPTAFGRWWRVGLLGLAATVIGNALKLDRLGLYVVADVTIVKAN